MVEKSFVDKLILVEPTQIECYQIDKHLHEPEQLLHPRLTMSTPSSAYDGKGPSLWCFSFSFCLLHEGCLVCRAFALRSSSYLDANLEPRCPHKQLLIAWVHLRVNSGLKRVKSHVNFYMQNVPAWVHFRKCTRAGTFAGKSAGKVGKRTFDLALVHGGYVGTSGYTWASRVHVGKLCG